MRRISRVLGIAILVVAVVLMTGQARAVIPIIYETGQELGYCTFFGANCGVGTTCGTAATITLLAGTNIANSQDTIAYVTSLDETPDSTTHWWAQGGIVFGLTPSGVFYNQPEIYFETNGSYYTWHAIMSTTWSSHILKVSIEPGTSTYVDLFVDGVLVSSLPMPSGFNQGGSATNFVEVHQYSSAIDTATAGWSSLQYLAPAGVYACTRNYGWVGWDCPGCPVGTNTFAHTFQNPPYLFSTQYITAFSIYTSGSGGGGGCHPSTSPVPC